MAATQGYFAVHSQGLGHATRAVALARGLTERRPDLSFLFLAGIPALDLVAAHGFDVLVAPPAPDWPSSGGVIGPVWRWYAEYAKYLRVARRHLRKETDWESYRFLVSDGEVAAVREALRRKVPTAMILDSIPNRFARDLPSQLFETFGNRWLARIARRIDLILATGTTPDWPNVRRIGPIVRPFSAPREDLRDDFVFRKKVILVAVGGTGIGEFLLRATEKAFHQADLEDASLVVVSGPKLKWEPSAGVYTYGFLPNLQDYILAADLVITTAGAGTVNEALAAGTPVIAIPPKGHVEAERTAAALGFRHEDLHRLDELMPQKLALGRLPPKPPGNEEAVRLLLEFLDSKVGPS
jgi:UDP-N-acetylglucosamine--N-acetylmuramyl-(pentapeptide) pyrophosphoryl-undecaprenol N-acetylglucosamine transferase